MAEATVGALLVGSYCKQGERINLNIQGSGYFQQALVDAYPDGAVRGYVIGRDGVITEGESGGPWGTGFLSVLRTKDQEGERPYIGTVPLLTGHLAKDLTFYWAQSEQIRSAVGIAANQDENGNITSAGGFLIQAFPGATAEEIAMVERHITEMGSFPDQIAQNGEPLSVLSQIFQDTAFMVVEEKSLIFRCTCSWERVKRALTLVGPAELRDILAKDQSASVKCDFCSKEYNVDAAMLQKLIERGEGKEEPESEGEPESETDS